MSRLSIGRRMAPAPHAPPIFTKEQCAALLGAIAVHDTVDLAAELPATINLDFDPALLERCYWLNVQLWREIEPGALARLAGRLARGRTLDAADTEALKDVRARAKQLRFARAMFAADHAYPPLLDRLTRLMGQAQDAMRTGRRLGAMVRGALLRIMATRVGSAAIMREATRFAATTPQALRAHITAETETVRQMLGRAAVTDKAFHEARKVVSRLVALYDMLKVLAPTHDFRAIDRYLGTINGLMGGMHDRMVERKAFSRRDYHHAVAPLPPEVAERLARLVAALGEPTDATAGQARVGT